MNRRYVPPKKKSNNILTFAIVLILLAIVCVVFILITILKEDNQPSVSKTTSSQSLITSVSSQAANAASSGVINSIADNTSSKAASQEQSQSNEEYKYKIDITPWEQYIDPQDDTPFLILANKTNPLDKDYVPSGMIDVVNTRKDGRATQQMVKTAEKALEAFLLEGKENGVKNVTVTSAYRSYSYQEQLFNSYVNQNMSKYSSRAECEKYVETFSARPGTSEHQTGLVCDMHNLSSAEVTFAKTPEAKWLAQNAYRFGFILRYPENKTEITGYQYEPWHFRFVGRKAATEIYKNGWCLEEYIDHTKNK